MNYKYQVGQEIPVGGIIAITGFAHNKNGNPIYNTDRGVVMSELLIESLEMKPLEKAQPEPKQEPVKLYCVEDYDPGEFLTKGKVYEYVPGKGFPYDDEAGYPEKDYATWARFNPILSACLVPLVSRAAKVGEWIYIKNKIGGSGFSVGDIGKVEKLSFFHGDVCAFDDEYIDRMEYLVLDGYRPEPEPEKAEPECLNMRVVCVDDGNCSCCWIVGAPYKVINGEIRDKDGERMLNNVTSLDDLNSRLSGKFIEFKGE